MELEIRIEYPSALFAESVRKALSPDDKLASSGMRIAARRKGCDLHVIIKACDKIETLQATAQDVFRCLHAAESSLSRLTQLRGEKLQPSVNS